MNFIKNLKKINIQNIFVINFNNINIFINYL